MVMGQKQNLLCKLGLHRWRDYGESVVIAWKVPEISLISAGRRLVQKSEESFTKKKCLRCGIEMKRKLIHNPDGTLSCIGWEPLSESKFERLTILENKLLASLTQGMNIGNLHKYFVHGALYSILGPVLIVRWFDGLFSVDAGDILWNIIGLVIFLFIVGGLNCILTFFLWFPIKISFLNVFYHGFVLSIALLIVNVMFNLIPNIVFPSVLTAVITFIVGAFFGGMAGKAIAGFWRKGERTPYPML